MLCGAETISNQLFQRRYVTFWSMVCYALRLFSSICLQLRSKPPHSGVGLMLVSEDGARDPGKGRVLLTGGDIGAREIVIQLIYTRRRI